MNILNTIKVDDTISLEIVDHAHAGTIYNLVDANRQQLREWLPWVDNMHTVEFIKNFITDSKKRYDEKSDFAYVILLNDTIVGRIGVYKIDHQNKIGSIGYWLGYDIQGKGIITKTCKELTSYCFNNLDLNRIEIKCGTENYKSQAIPERLNFEKEGTIRQGELVYNKFIDLFSYAMLRDEWLINKV
ncbi:MAG: GNAT family protein [Bacteroidia bacterium]